MIWDSITLRKDFNDVSSDRTTPFAAYVYNRISENYRRVFESIDNKMPIRYKEAQLLTDMISGMTDTYAMTFYKEIKKFRI